MTLEEPLNDLERRSERRWAAWSLGFLLVFGLSGLWVSYQFLSRPVAPAPPVDHGSLPAAVKAKALGTLGSQLDRAQLEERWERGRREFRVLGTPRNPLVSEFSRNFRPLVATELMPLLRPYGETISFDIYNTDLPPVRLRNFDPPQPSNPSGLSPADGNPSPNPGKP